MSYYKKKLVYILHSIEVGGVEVALLSSIPLLCKKYDLKVIVLGKINQSLIKEFTNEERGVFHTFTYPVYLYPFVIKNVLNYVNKFSPEYVICSLWRASLVGTLLKKRNDKLKLFIFIHSVKFFHYADKYFTIGALGVADKILADSHSSHDFIKTMLENTCPIEVVSFLTNTTPPFRKIRKMREEGEVKMMSLGRLNKVKNLPLTIKVISQLRKLGFNVTLDIFGRRDNSYEEIVLSIQKYNLEDFISFKGEVSPTKKFELFNNYDYYIQLSAFEGMAMSVAEAMQNGLPCIVSPVGEIPNYSRDLESAIFFDIWDANKWDESVIKISEVLKNESLYMNIAEKCWENFEGKPLFVQSLIQSLEN